MKVAVISLKSSPGHMAHLRAYRELFTAIANVVEMFLAPDYEAFMGKADGITYTEDIQKIVDSKPDLVFIYNISTSNIPLAKACKKAGIKTVYVLHEPRGSLKELLAEGKDTIKTIGANVVSSIICRNVDKVLLASEIGRKNYETYMQGCNRNYDVFPLIFMDEYDAAKQYERKYFSFIGGFTDVHACNEFLKFVEYALSETDDVKFLIATKTDIGSYLQKPALQNAISSGRLVAQAGRPMTTEEINGFYRQSICVWNAYNRSTQSGVLPNALMQGTPVIVNDKGAAKEIMIDKTVGCFITMPPDNKKILQAFRYIESHLDEMTHQARNMFLEKYYYSGYLDVARRVILV